MRRAKKRLDYKRLHETGEKVYIENSASMSMSETKQAGSITAEFESKVVCKIDRFLEESDLNLFYDIEEIQIAIEKSRSILQEYEDVHVELKNELGTEDYIEKYTEYTKIRTSMMTWIKNAKLEIGIRRKNFSEQKFVGLRAEEQFLRKIINMELQNFENEIPILLEGHERQLAVAEQLISEYTNLFHKIEMEGPTFSQEFGDLFVKIYTDLNKVIVRERRAIQNCKLDSDAAEKNRQEIEASERSSREKDELILSCKSIYVNICDRFSALEKKLKVVISDLTDAQVLEKRNDFKILEREYNDILDKILKLSQSNPGRYDETRDLVLRVNDRKENLKDSLELHQAKVAREILERDISEEKVKNASLLGIKLPKFSDYKSEIDFYSFKSKFLTLFAPDMI